jgi:NSS family neurotransmitter:Na+ symporter
VYAVLYAGEVPGKDGALLLFEALPLAFDHLMWGRVYLTAFFVMLVLAAWLLGIALLEPLAMWLSERFTWTRGRVALVTGICAWVVSVVCLLSFNAWQFSFRFFGELRIYGVFDAVMIAANQVLLPVVGIGTALFAGWLFRAELSREQLNLRSPCAFDAWLWSIRIVIPLVLLWIMLQLSSSGL